jgi:hypothetical protein
VTNAAWHLACDTIRNRREGSEASSSTETTRWNPWAGQRVRQQRHLRVRPRGVRRGGRALAAEQRSGGHAEVRGRGFLGVHRGSRRAENGERVRAVRRETDEQRQQRDPRDSRGASHASAKRADEY